MIQCFNARIKLKRVVNSPVFTGLKLYSLQTCLLKRQVFTPRNGALALTLSEKLQSSEIFVVSIIIGKVGTEYQNLKNTGQ